MAPFTKHSIVVSDAGRDGHLRIEIEQMSQDSASMTSDVRVAGYLVNDNNFSVQHDGGQTVERDISGESAYNPSDFDFNIGPNNELCYISHVFTIAHNTDGTKTVTFTVHYGTTGTNTFNNNKSVSDTLTLTPFDVGAWIRTSTAPVGMQQPGSTTPRWIHGVPYVRYQGKWKRAVPYVRSGGVWKACQ